MKRIVELDILRGIAMIGVIGIHATVYVMPIYTSYWSNGPAVIFLNQFFRFSTPLFLFLSGITLTLSQNHRPLPTMQFYKRRFIRIAIPYALWTIFFTIKNTGFVSLQTAKISLENLVTAHSEYHMYFVLLIVQCYLLFPFLFVLLRKCANRQKGILAIGLIAAQAIGLFVYMQLRLNHRGVSEDTAFRFVGFWLVYFCFGMLAAEQFAGIVAMVKRWPVWFWGVLTVGLALGLTFETKFYQFRAGYDATDFFRPSVLLYTIIATPFWLWCSTVTRHTGAWATWCTKTLHSIGRHSLGIYFIHTIFVSFLANHILPIGIPYVAAVGIILVGTLAASWASVFVYNQLRFGVVRQFSAKHE